MRIGVNARLLTQPFTGIGRYTRSLFSSMASMHPEDTFVLVSPKEVQIDMPKNVELITLPEIFPGSGGMKKTYWEQVQLPRFFKKYGVDIVHFPYPSNPWRKYKIPTVVTVHDTIPWVMPEYRSSLSTRAYQDRCKRSLQYADQVTCVSQATCDDLIALLPALRFKTFVAENGISESYGHHFSDDEITSALLKYGLDPKRKYFLYLGGYDVRKNVTFLVDTYLKNISNNYDVDLVLVGGKVLQGKLYESYDLALEASSANVRRGKLRFPGFVEEKDLPYIFAGSLAFVNLSKAEGFNLPLLEALCAHTPSVVSNIPIHREVAGEHAFFVDLNDEKQLATLMDKFCTDEDFAGEIRQDLKAYRCPYNWERTALKVYQHYEKLL